MGKQRHDDGVRNALADLGMELAPYVAAIAAFAGGVLMVASAATPGVAERLSAVARVAPIFVIEFSHFASSLVGLLLMLIGGALWRRRQGAYWAAITLLLVGVVLELTKGLEYESAAVLLGMAFLLWLARKAFDRPSRILTIHLEPVWLVAAVGGVVSAFLLGLWAYDGAVYTNEMWWTFVRDGDAARSLRAEVVVALATLLAALWLLFAPPSPRLRRPSAQDIAKVAAILSETEDAPAGAGIWLSGDKDFLFSESGRSVIAYRIRRRHWIALNDPIGPSEDREALMWTFVESADRAGGKAVFYGVTPDLLPPLAAMGFVMRQVGEDAVVDAAAFHLTGKSRQNLRTACNKAAEAGCAFEVLPPGSASALGAELKAVSDAWLAELNGSEKGFSMGFFDLAYLDRSELAVVRRQGEILAFANVLTTAGKGEAEIDLMRYRPGVLHGLMDYLFVQLVLWAKAEGYARFNLGMAPLSGLSNRRLAPLFARIGALVYSNGGAFYGFQGLHSYKAKFGPNWRPVYLAGRPGVALTQALLDVALLTGRGWRGVFKK